MDKIKRLPVFSLVVLFLATGMTLLPLLPQNNAAARESSLVRQATSLQNLYRGLVSLSFDFSQVTRTGGRERQGRGNAVFFRPQNLHDKTTGGPQAITHSVMRWNYTAPDRQVIMSDGKTLSIYTAKDRQMIKVPADKMDSDITYTFFAGTGNLLDNFEVLPPDPRFVYGAANKLQAIRLVPKRPHNQIKAVQLWFDQKNIIHHLVIEDPFGSVTELTFTNIRLNSLPTKDQAKLHDILFFTPPPGTEMISR
ncbi:lipoprotein chaperone [bacterium BMS3Bbin14]|nr:lipoprotein chaperone [bacterium BMS3Abin13]GBE52767.1 lipoprotein chaperone [bacterium BMS3Bbin14]HDO29801.1 outer membrane lipoprotein carrier protein LolA [Desulfobacteraceae bacterium]